MKKIRMIIICSILLIGCSSDKEKNNSVELSKDNGEVIAITLDEVIEKVENKESFVVIFSQTYCGSCIDFFIESDEYTIVIGLTLYDVSLDKESRDVDENMEIINKYFDNFSVTPAIYYVENGTVKDALNANNEEVNLNSFKEFLKENNIQ